MKKKTAVCFVAIVATSLPMMAIAVPKIPPKYPASPREILSLPKYCYHQYVDGSLSGPMYSIPASMCGYEMNHFCPGLVNLTQAMQVTRSMSERRDALSGAIVNIDYTIRGMKPGCFIAGDVQNAKTRARMLSNLIK